MHTCVHCVGCGGPVQPRDTRCGACRTPVRGASLKHRVVVQAGRSYASPGVCCCCLRPREVLDTHTIDLGRQANYRYTFSFKLPWCRSCQMTRWMYNVLLTIVVGGVLGLGVWFGVAQGLGLWPFLGTMLGALVVGGIAAALLLYLPSFNRPGHVNGCDAFEGSRHGMLEARTVRLTFGNKAFAQAFEELNGRRSRG